jgi:hypothetical protein
MSQKTHESAVMVLLPYTPRADSGSRGYHDWLRTVDNPFFNSVPGILHYSNWLVDEVVRGSLGFTHFDFMIMEGPDSPAGVWSNQAVVDFAAGWTRNWGAEPENPDLSVNYHSAMASRVSGALPQRSNRLWLGLDAGPAATSTDSEVWKMTEPMVGKPTFNTFCFRFIHGNAPQPGADWSASLALGSLIAAPDA